MKQKVKPVLIVTALILIIIVAVAAVKIIGQYMPTREEQDLFEYFGIAGTKDMDSYSQMVDSGEPVIPVELNLSLTEEKALRNGSQTYINFEYVHDQLNDRFYWDENENVLLYTTASDVIKAEVDSNEYTIGKQRADKDYKIAVVRGQEVYVALDFVAEYTNMTYQICDEPERVLIQTKWGTMEKASAKRKTQLRVAGGIKSNILRSLKKGDSLIVLEAMEKWTRVATEDGLVGYVKNKHLSAAAEETVSHEFAEEEFTHQTRDYKINMAWHQVTVKSANSTVASVLQSTKGINVISPTWFYLNDNDGNIENLASNDYVKYCHDHKVEVWALVSNLENTEVSTTEVLTHTSKRENLTNQLIAAAIQYNLDGINVDFEALESAVGEGFIQFIRELSLKCEDNGLVLSVDNYVSSEYTRFYDREEQAVYGDYVVIMGYDEHYVGSDEGSVASIGFVRQASDDILDEGVPAEQVILGMPFYTRIWAEKPKETDGDDVETASEDYVPYELSSEAVGMQEAQRRIEANGAQKVWLADQGQNYAEYENSGITYKVWLEDSASLEERLKVMQEHGFAGAAFWKLGFEDSVVWDTIIKYVN